MIHMNCASQQFPRSLSELSAVQSPASLIQAWTMSKHFRPWNIDQTLLLPPNVRDFVPKDHVSRFIPVELLPGEYHNGAPSGYRENRWDYYSDRNTW